MNKRERVLQKLAQSWTDQAAIDWGAAEFEAGLTPGEFEKLRALDAVTQALRRIQHESDGAHTQRPTPLFHWGALEVLEALDRGAQGEVYRAYDPLLAQTVALKLIRTDRAGSPSLAQVLGEVRGLAQVRHPNVLSVYGAAEHDGRFCIWTELIDGQTLDQELDARGPLPIDDVLAIGRDLCAALAAVHARGLIHGDVKCSNVMRERGGRIVLADFGACRLAAESAALASVAATAAYLPPEVLRGERDDAGRDVYALAVLLYRLLSSRFPQQADSLDPMAHGRDAAIPEPLTTLRPTVPESLSALLAQALAPDPAMRAQSLSEFAHGLGEIARARHSSVRRAAGLRRYALVALIAGLAAVGLWRFTRPPPAAPAQTTLAFAREHGDQLAALPSDAELHLGDLLALSLSLQKPAHLYVLNEDSNGRVSLLFPLPELDQRNPLPAAALELPGRLHGQPFRWRISSATQREEFLVVIAPAPLPELDAAQVQAEPASVRVEAERGVGELAPQRRAIPQFSGTHLAAVASAIARRADAERIELRRFAFAQRD